MGVLHLHHHRPISDGFFPSCDPLKISYYRKSPCLNMFNRYTIYFYGPCSIAFCMFTPSFHGWKTRVIYCYPTMSLTWLGSFGANIGIAHRAEGFKAWNAKSVTGMMWEDDVGRWCGKIMWDSCGFQWLKGILDLLNSGMNTNLDIEALWIEYL
jgi:hypothetical protein